MKNNSSAQIEPQRVQSATMAFANRYVAAMADVYEQVLNNSTSPQARFAAQRAKFIGATAAVGNAVELNPLAGLMDMAVVVSLTREIAEEPWVQEQYGENNARAIVTALKNQEADVWQVTSEFLTPDQIKELRDVAVQWKRDHPNRRFAWDVRLADFPQAKKGQAPGGQLVSSVFGIVTLDPFTGLDPAVKEVEQSRVLAERMFFYLRYLPIFLSWQVDALYLQILATPQVEKLLADTTTVAGSTTRFTDSTNKFADVSGKFAETLEKFRVQLPEQQSTLVDQMNQLVATQRNAALLQATTQVSIEREATVKQLNTTVSAQQAELTRNMQLVIDASIDRLYARIRSIVLIAAGAILGVLVIYRLIAGKLLRGRGS